MEKEKIALNFALMIEKIRAAGKTNDEMIQILDQMDCSLFEKMGEGVPNWQTMLDFYKDNTRKCKNAILEGYQITFLTKGALKSLLKIKYNQIADEDYKDEGERLTELKIKKADLVELASTLSTNWAVIPISESTEEEMFIQIELKRPNK